MTAFSKGIATRGATFRVCVGHKQSTPVGQKTIGMCLGFTGLYTMPKGNLQSPPLGD